jgi:hypothetical protein
MRARVRKRGAVTRAGAAGGGQVAELSYALREVRAARARAGCGHRGRDRSVWRPCGSEMGNSFIHFRIYVCVALLIARAKCFCPQEQGARAEAEEARAQAEEAYGCISQQVARARLRSFFPCSACPACLFFYCTYDWPGPQHLHPLPVQIDRIREVEIERRQVALPRAYTPCPHP